MKKKYKLENINFPKNSKVVKNVFTTYDPSNEYDVEESFLNLQEDLLQVSFEDQNQIVDLGWYGDFDKNEGSFIIYIIKDQDWDNPLQIEKSKSQKEITKALKLILSKI